jgi:ATP-dependent Clp protease ATP-binding subunit ClpC
MASMPGYNRYSHHARRALSHARALVTRFRHPLMDTAHLLVGVLLTRGSIGSQVLLELDINPEIAQRHLKGLLPRIEPPPDDIEYTAELDEALALSEDEANWLGHHYVGTEHFLLGITRTNAGNASALLHLLTVSPEHVRFRARTALNRGAAEPDLQLAKRNAHLTELSRRIITAAEQLAVTLDHPLVGLGHLLLVLYKEERSSTYILLQNSGLDESRLRQGLDAEDSVLLVSIEGILNIALDRAESMGSHYTGTEHLLLTLLLDPTGISVMEQYGVHTDDMRRRLESQLRGKST